MSASTQQKCERRVFSGQRCDLRGHRCGNNAVAQEDGKWLCRIHTAAAVQKRKDERDKKYQAEREETRKLYAEQAERNRRADLFPEMLGALKDKASKMKCVCKMLGYIGEEPPCETCQLNALIAKAEGR